jgi:hypothetical protein
MSNLLNVLRRIETHQPSEFLAPVPDVQQVVLFTLQDNIPYRFLIPTVPGWQYFRPQGARAVILRPGQPFEYIPYLAALRSIQVMVVFRVSDTSWLVIPNNIGEAAQRGWKHGAPKVMHLVTEALQPFDLVLARVMGGTLLYDELLSRGQPAGQRETSQARQMMLEHQEEARRLDAERIRLAEEALKRDRKNRAEAEKALRQAQWEARAREALGFMGAQMVDWTAVNGNSFNVTWEFNGRQATTRINRDLIVESAGFCLAGTDRQHTLTDIVRVMEDAVEAGRRDGMAAQYGGYRDYDDDYRDDDD